MEADTPSAPRPDTSSATKVFAKSAARGFLPSAAAIGGGALAAQSLPFAHFAPPWSEIGAGLVGGVASGFAAEKLQSAIVPQDVQDSIFPSELEDQNHPIASQLGGLASAAPFMNPVKGVQSLYRGGGLLKDLVTKPIAGGASAILTQAERQGLKNLAINAGVGVGSQVGIDTAQQLAGDQPFDYTRAGINALGGLILNEPTKFSQRRLGMHPSFEGVPTRGEILSQREGLSSANRQPIGNEPAPASPDYPERYNEPAYQINALAKGADDKFVVDDATINTIFGREYPKLAGASKIEGQGLVPNTKVEMTLQQKREFLDQVMRERTDTAEDFGTPLELRESLQRLNPDYSRVRQSDSALEMMQARKEQARYEQQNKRESGRGNISKYGSPQYQVEAPPVIGLNKSKGKAVEIQQRQEYNGGKNQGPYKYSEGETSPLAVDVRKQEIDAAVDEALKKRGMTMGTYGKPIVDASGNPVVGRNTGNRIAGNVDTTRREMNISDKGGPDTAFHEVGHQQLMDLATSADPKDRELVGKIFAEHGKPEITAEKFLELNRAVDEAVGRGDHNAANAIREQFLAAEEEIVQYAGLESSSRKLEKRTFVPKAKQYIKDYASRLGMGDKPATQQLSARQEYEAPYGTRGVEAPRVESINTSADKQSEIPTKYGAPQENDYEQYLDVQKRISAKIKAGEFEGEEFKKLWQENEDIKNRNGGMPPKPVEKVVENVAVEEPIKKTDVTKEPDTSTKESEIPSRYKERDEDTFELSTQKVLRNPKPFGLSPDKDGKFSGNTVADKLPSSIPKMELEILKKAGIEDFLRYKRRSASEIEEWVKEHGPKVKVESYGMEGKVSEAKREYDRMTHEWLDTLPRDAAYNVRSFMDGNITRSQLKSGVLPEVYEKTLKYSELREKTIDEDRIDNGPRATSAYSHVSALDTTQPMPEWTTSKSGKNVQRVDVVIPVKHLDYDAYAKAAGWKYPERPENRSAYEEAKKHYLANAEPELWQPDNLHENLPNTLGWAMIQYKTGPKGEKIAVIAEAQSRWGQEQRKYEQIVKENEASGMKRGIADHEDKSDSAHPLLKDYNRLILKAAIDQARKEGATHIMVSDAETAMMTEGHDAAGSREIPVKANSPAEAIERVKQEHPESHSHKAQLEDDGKYIVTTHGIKPTQELGMRLNYDTILPKIAEELTGSKGERMSVREHKNAYTGIDSRQEFSTLRAAQQHADMYGGEVKKVGLVYDVVKEAPKRENLIFKNQDGTPKTDVSGTMYPIDSVSSRLSQEPFTLTDKKFSEIPSKYAQEDSPEFKKWFGESKVVDKEGKPLRVYHGSVNKGVYIFDTTKVTERTPKGDYPGTYFTDKPENASGFTRPSGAKGFVPRGDITEAYLSLQNPLNTTALIKKYQKQGMSFGEAKRKALTEITPEHDGIVFDGNSMNPPEYVAFKAEQIKSATGNSGAFDSRNPDIRFSETPSKYKPSEDPNILPKKSLTSFTTSVADKIVEGKESSPIHKKVSEAFRSFFLDSEKNAGKYGQSIARLYQKYSPSEVADHYKNRWERDNGLPQTKTLNGKALELDNAFQTIIERPKLDAATEGLRVKDGEDYRVGGIKKEGYLYNMFDPEILHTIDNEPTSIEAKKSMRQWKEWLVKKGMKEPDAVEAMNSYLRARRDYGDTGGPEFSAMRKAEGMGLPWELIDKNPARAALRYGKRAGNDLAYFKNFQKDNEILHALGLKDQFQKNPEGVEGVDYIGSEKNIQDALKFVWGKNTNSNPRFAALMRVAGNLVMGHGTAIRNIASIPAQMSIYDTKLKDVFNGLSKLSKTRERAYEMGAAKVNTSEYEYLGDLSNPDPWVKNLDKMSEFLRKWQGRNMSDKFEGELIYSVGEEWAKNMLATKNMDMLKRASGKSDYSIPTKVTQADISDLAAGYTRLVRGSYGPTGLPNWALTGNVAPFVALNRYGIEKWNNVNKDVIQPLKKGNVKPFLAYTLASLGTGAMIEEMNQLLSNKKGSDLNISEALAAYAETQDPEILSQKVIGLMQMASYGGIISDFAKMASRAAAGKEISYSNPVGMPLYTLATETFAENFGGMAGAIRDGEDPINAISQFIKSFAVNTIQISRYASGHIEKDETERKESFGDYRKYQEATGKSSREELTASKGNPYQDMDAKKFKKTDDIKEAASLVPSLIQKAIKDSKGDPYKLKAEFRKLKSNNFQIMPSPETQPTEFYEYVNYLNKTIGPEKTALRVRKFFTQKAVNKAKNTMVP
jgi:hypothetical protein